MFGEIGSRQIYSLAKKKTFTVYYPALIQVLKNITNWNFFFLI